jgi:hypothetical protein
MHVAMAKRCNMQMYFLFLNKKNVIRVDGGYGQRWGILFSIIEESVEEGSKGEINYGC